MVVALGCSLAMALPISTPPNAIAYATGAIRTKDLASIGVAVGAFGLVLAVFAAPPMWRLMGLVQ